jgi:hypothetical protein
MSAWSFSHQATQRIPFILNGRRGHVAVYYGIDDDPVGAGFDVLPGLNFDIALCRGYPVVQAAIEEYEGSGYRTLCGWIQIVTDEFRDHDQGNTTEGRWASVDLVPAMRESGVPFACFGNLPQWFDAPCHNLGEHAELTWVADTFLTTLPLRSRQEEISWLMGFRWGYNEYATLAHKPVQVLPLEITGAEVWNSHLLFLRQECSSWRFRDA